MLKAISQATISTGNAVARANATGYKTPADDAADIGISIPK